jgi:hypothetical protein
MKTLENTNLKIQINKNSLINKKKSGFFYLFLILFILLGLLLSSCKPKQETFYPRQKMLAKSWRGNSVKIAGIETFNFLPACKKDDILTFMPFGNLAWNESTTKCSPTAPDLIAASTWVLNQAETHLYVRKGIVSTQELEIFEILELTETTARFKINIINGAGLPIQYEYGFVVVP